MKPDRKSTDQQHRQWERNRECVEHRGCGAACQIAVCEREHSPDPMCAEAEQGAWAKGKTALY